MKVVLLGGGMVLEVAVVEMVLKPSFGVPRVGIIQNDLDVRYIVDELDFLRL